MMNSACIFNIQKFSIHDGPGIRTTVFFKGCPLRCVWCSNPESQKREPEKMQDSQTHEPKMIGEYKTLEEITNEVLKDQVFYEESGGGVTLSGGEVLLQAPFATELLRRLKEKEIHTVSETTGFAKQEEFSAFIDQVDLLYFDVKHHEEQKHKQGTGVSLKPILSNLALALEKKQPMIVRIPVIPGYNDGAENAERFADLFREMGLSEVELLPFHQFGEKKYTLLARDYEMKALPQLHTEELTYFKDILESSGISCLIQ